MEVTEREKEETLLVWDEESLDFEGWFMALPCLVVQWTKEEGRKV